MKLVLASQGFTTPDIANGIAELAGRPLAQLHVAVINEAYTGIRAGHDDHWMVEELSWLAKYCSGALSMVSLRAHDLAEIRRRLEPADLIYIVGGAQIVLPKLFRDIGFDVLLRELAEHTIIMGTSAGANVLGQQITDRQYWEDQYGTVEQYLAEPALGLVDWNILPHFERADHPLRTRSRLAPLLVDHPFPLYGLTDTQAVVWDDGEMKFLGGQPATFGGHGST